MDRKKYTIPSTSPYYCTLYCNACASNTCVCSKIALSGNDLSITWISYLCMMLLQETLGASRRLHPGSIQLCKDTQNTWIHISNNHQQSQFPPVCHEPHPSTLGAPTFFPVSVNPPSTTSQYLTSSNPSGAWVYKETSGLCQGKGPCLLYYLFLNHLLCVKLCYNFYSVPILFF